VVAAALDGTLLRLEVPAGALHAEVDLTLTPGAPPADGLASFGIEPTGLWFELPVKVSITLPAGSSLPADAVLALGSPNEWTYVATERDTASGRLSAEVSLLGFGPDFALNAAGLGPAQQSGDTVAAIIANCRLQLANAKQTLQGLLAGNSYVQALKLISDTSALAVNCTLLEEAQDWLALIPGVACGRYADLALVAETNAADGYGIFYELVTPVFHWVGVLANLGIDQCEGEPAYDAIFREKLEQLLSFVNARVAAAYEVEFEELMVEAVRLWQLSVESRLLGLPESASLIESTALYAVMAQMREKGYEFCGVRDTHYYLSALFTDAFRSRKVTIPTSLLPARSQADPVFALAGLATPTLSPASMHASFTDEDLQVDLQYCASSMELHVWADPDVPHEVTEQFREITGGIGPGEFMATAAAVAPIEGHLVLNGHVAQFRCGESGTAADPLVFLFQSREADRATASGDTLMTAPKELAVRELSDLAAYDPELLNTGELVVRREGDACGGRFGKGKFDLFTIDLSIDPVPALYGVTTSTSQIPAGDWTRVTFTLPLRDEGKNLSVLEITAEFGGARVVREIELRSDPRFGGFDNAHGNGSFYWELDADCSDAGKNPIVYTFKLIDEFNQTSSGVSTSLTVDWGACEASTALGSPTGGEVGRGR